MERQFHETPDAHVARLTELFCLELGLTEVQITYDMKNQVYMVSYLLPVDFDWTMVCSYIVATNKVFIRP